MSVNDRRSTVKSNAAMAVFAGAYVLVALLVRDSYYQLMLTLVLVWACFGLSWNVLSGYTGLVSFGHAAFFGLGAYTTALGQLHLGWSPYVLIPIAAAVYVAEARPSTLQFVSLDDRLLAAARREGFPTTKPTP